MKRGIFILIAATALAPCSCFRKTEEVLETFKERKGLSSEEIGYILSVISNEKEPVKNRCEALEILGRHRGEPPRAAPAGDRPAARSKRSG